MNIIDIIDKKRLKQALSADEIEYVIINFTKENIPDYQMSALLMAICLNGMSDDEIGYLTKAMLASGYVVKHEDISDPIIDKHSTGGVGDKITIPLAPIMASLGVKVPSIAGRGLGHTGGTLDKLEAIPGFRTKLSLQEYKAQLKHVGAVIMGQTKEIAPADKKIYALRDVTATVASIPLIASSIMSKKLAEGLDGLVLDVKFGSGAFMTSYNDAFNLAKTMVAIGQVMGKKVTALLTNMDQPLGEMIGNALEIVESIAILQDKGPSDSTLLTYELGAEMLLLTHKVSNKAESLLLIKEAISSGRAFSKFMDMCKAQGGDISVLDDPKKLIHAKKIIPINAIEDGYIHSINSKMLGQVVGILGGGRIKITDNINPDVGLKIQVKIGDKIVQGMPIVTIYADHQDIEHVKEMIIKAITIVKQPIDKPLLIKEKITTT